VRGDVGNSFVFSFDLLGSLLEVISRDHVELFRYASALVRRD
jgi:hypothetical protein